MPQHDEARIGNFVMPAAYSFMKIRSQIICASLIALVVSGSAGLWAQVVTGEQPELPRRVAVRFLTEADFPPFNYNDEEGVLTGFNIDIARAVCLEMAATCDIQARPWDELAPALRKGEADAVIASHAITPRNLAEFDFTDRYFYTPAWFAGRRGSEPMVPTPEGLEGQKIGVARGSPHEAYLRTFFRDSAVVPFENVDVARDALIAGQINLVFDDGVSLVFWLNGTLSRECCELKGGPFMEAKYFGDGIGIMLPKRDAQLKTLMNQALKRVRASGRYEELMLRYFPYRLY